MNVLGTYTVRLTGSKKNIKRTVYTDGNRFFIKWYGNMIEVRRETNDFYTVEAY